jgi:hypothetical protein
MAMRVATVLAGVLLVMLDSGRAYAQAIEVGAGLSLSCQSDEVTPCEDVWGRVDAVHVSWWSTPSIVVEARIAHLAGPDRRIVAVTERVADNRFFSRSYTLRDERRTALQSSLLYHFRPTGQLRPFIGGGIGSVWWRADAFCEARQVDCQSVLPTDAPGVSSREWVISFAGGLAVEAWGETIIRTGVRDTAIPSTMFQREFDDEARRRRVTGQLPEFFMNVGYRW